MSLRRFNLPLPRLLVTGSSVVIDQIFFSMGNYISTLLLARWMTPTTFGVYATIQSLSQITGSIYASLMLEPMSVLGVSLFASRQKAYQKVLRTAHVWLSLALALVAAPILWIALGTSNTSLVGIAIAFIIFLPFFLVTPFARRHYYNERRITVAAGISAVYFVLLPIVLLLLQQSRILSSITAWIAAAASSAVATSAIVIFVREGGRLQEAPLDVKCVVREHWVFGRWDLIGTVALMFAGQIPIIAMTRWFGPGTAGALRALIVVSVPVAWLIAPASSAILPAVATAEARGDRHRATSLSFMLSAGMTGLALAYLLAAYLFAVPVVHLLYAGKYDEVAWMVPLLSLQHVLNAATVGCGVQMRAARWPKFLAISAAVTVVVSCITTLALVRSRGLEGTVYAIVIMNFATYASRMAIYGWWRRHHGKRLPAARPEVGQHSPLRP
jgi:O-antigen/teichoic acid export membrane protein